MKKNKFIIISWACSLLVLIILLYSNKTTDPLNNTEILVMLFTFILLILLPFAKKFKIGDLEVILEDIKTIKDVQYNGEVVISDGAYYFVKEKQKYTIPNENTAKLLKTYKGYISLPSKEIKLFEDAGSVPSLTSEYIKHTSQGDYFIIWNTYKVYIGSWSILYDCFKEEEIMKLKRDSQIISFEDLLKKITLR
jgi:hypothetical protein